MLSSRNIFVPLGAALGLVLIALIPVNRALGQGKHVRPQWEYEMLEVSTDSRGQFTDGVNVLNRAGSEGWELVSTTHDKGVAFRFYLKRQK